MQEALILSEVQAEIEGLRRFVNPMNLKDLFPEDIKPFSNTNCIYSHCLGTCKGAKFQKFVDNNCNFLVVNNLLDNQGLTIKSRDVYKHKIFVWDTTKGDYVRLFDYLTCLEYYMIIHPEKNKAILDYIKSVTDTLTI